MIENNLLKAISVEGSWEKAKDGYSSYYIYRKKEENTQWEYLTQAGKECREKEKASYDTEADPSEGLMNILEKICEDGDDDDRKQA